jgi:hypothetical protein
MCAASKLGYVVEPIIGTHLGECPEAPLCGRWLVMMEATSTYRAVELTEKTLQVPGPGTDPP